VSSSSKVIAGTAVIAVVAAAGAAFAAMKLSDTVHPEVVASVTAPYGAGIAGSGLGGGRLGGRGFGGGLGPGLHDGFRFFHADASAAVVGYLGVTAAALRSALQKGKSLAEIAKAQGKTAAGLIAAIVADEKKQIENAVSNGYLTQAQAQQFESNLQQRVADVVNSVRPQFGGPPGPNA
jgi:hypothetical protein